MGTRRRSGIISRFCAAGLALGLLMLAGCTDDEPDPPPPTSSTPSSPTSTEPTDSPSPDPESAEDFIRRWADVNNDMKNTGNSDDFLALTRHCDPCQRLVDTVVGFYGAGGYVSTKGWRVDRVKRLSSPSSRRLIYSVDVDSSPTKYRESADGPVKHLPGGPARYRFTLLRLDDGWRVLDYMEVPR